MPVPRPPVGTPCQFLVHGVAGAESDTNAAQVLVVNADDTVNLVSFDQFGGLTSSAPCQQSVPHVSQVTDPEQRCYRLLHEA